MLRPWTSVRYLGIGVLTGLVSAVVLVLFLVQLVNSPLTLGVPLVFIAIPVVRLLTGVERARAARLLGTPISSPYRPVRGGLFARLTTVIADPATWRDLAWLVLHSLYGWLGLLSVALWLGGFQTVLTPLGYLFAPGLIRGFQPFGLPIDSTSRALLAVPIGVAYLGLALVLSRPLAIGEARLARWLLAPTAGALLARRVDDLTVSRAQAVDARAAELRRIERDLHDGAQARLVSLAMSLGMAEQVIHRDPEAAGRLLAEARGSAGQALTELRDLVRGIHPPVLADRGLVGGLEALALQCPVPVDLDLAPVQRLAAPVESALYFAAAEALTNVAKHSDATHASLTLSIVEDNVCVEVRDDGRGGADPDGGSGLAGIRGRVAAFDGLLWVSSPPGGPTIVLVRVPCES
jgi:signal transduction histidine kinase